MYSDGLRPSSAGKAYGQPAPIIEGIRLRHQQFQTPHPKSLDGLIDTGAEVTIVPYEFVEWAMRFVQPRHLSVSSVKVSGIDWGISERRPAIPAVIQVPGFASPVSVKCICADRGNVVLGRDALFSIDATLTIDFRRKRFFLY